jgi:hypothetical protein
MTKYMHGIMVSTWKKVDNFFFSFLGWGESPLGMSATNWPIVPIPDDDNECGAVGGMRIGRGN